MGLLFQSFEEHEFLVCGPFLVEERIVLFVDDVVFVGEGVDIAEAADAEIAAVGQDFGAFADIPLAVVALDLIRGIDDVLPQNRGT